MNVKEENLIAVPSLEENPKLHIEKKPIYSFLKRTFDIIFSLFGLLLLIVPLLIVALIVVIDSPGASPIYAQERIGKNGRKFKFYKFRSMVPNADKMLEQLLDKNEMEGPVFKIKDDPRITRFGHFIRITSIDELPQLWNVFKGDMSLVGPRPPLPREVKQYTEHQFQRLSVIPGITGYWQIQPKRNSLSFDEWLALDLKYISERSLWTDLKILFGTVRAVLGLEGE
ncbi:MAG: sugar transferase [Ruminococcaceae bacterium]|nr:sugar transferase [Oscillospiraceae bacterium]